MRSFPYEFASERKPLFHPGEPSSFTGDVLEIGPGRGEFLLSAAAAEPDRRFVAIEIKKRRFYKIAKRMEKRGLSNILLIQGDARIVIPAHFAEETFQRIYVLFPDPWPKRRHTGMRLLSCEFLRVLTRVLRPGGELILGTDAQEYLKWVTRNIVQVQEFESRTLSHPGDSQPSDWIPTFYEEKWRSEGRTINFVGYRKR